MIEIKLQHTQAVLEDSYFDGNLPLPFHGSEVSAGYDLTATSEPQIKGEKDEETGNWKRIDYIQYQTGIQIAPPLHDSFYPTEVNRYHNVYHTLLFPRSSVSKYNLQLANSIGLIDNDYRGELLLRFNYIWQPEDFRIYHSFQNQQGIGLANIESYVTGIINQNKIYKKGDKICQLVGEQTIFMNFNEVSSLDETSRGDGGFGHTGK